MPKASRTACLARVFKPCELCSIDLCETMFSFEFIGAIKHAATASKLGHSGGPYLLPPKQTTAAPHLAAVAAKRRRLVCNQLSPCTPLHHSPLSMPSLWNGAIRTKLPAIN